MNRQPASIAAEVFLCIVRQLIEVFKAGVAEVGRGIELAVFKGYGIRSGRLCLLRIRLRRRGGLLHAAGKQGETQQRRQYKSKAFFHRPSPHKQNFPGDNRLKR